MQFVPSTELRPGLRIAKSVYNKDGVLLYERNSRLTPPAISLIQSFDLTGIYILEPTEPAPSFTKEDLSYEQAQMIYLFKLKDLYEKVYHREPLDKLSPLVEDIIKRFGKLNSRINFNQNVRSTDDFMYKHAISVAILSSIVGQHINISEDDYKALITASLLYGFGYRFLFKNVTEKDNKAIAYNATTRQNALEKGLNYISVSTYPVSYLVKAIQVMEYFILSDKPDRKMLPPTPEVVLLAEILKVVIEFDMLTATIAGHKPASEIAAVNRLRKLPEKFDTNIVSILTQCIHIVPIGATVDLSTGDKGLVLIENKKDYMKPVILRLKDDTIYDLSEPMIYEKIQITDLTKTVDNRIEINMEAIQQLKADKRLP